MAELGRALGRPKDRLGEDVHRGRRDGDRLDDRAQQLAVDADLLGLAHQLGVLLQQMAVQPFDLAENRLHRLVVFQFV